MRNRLKPGQHRAVTRRCLLAVLIVAASTGGARAGPATAAACDHLSLDEILAHVNDVHRITDEPITFRQNIRLRAALFTWSFSTSAKKKGKSLQLSIQNGPWFLPEEVTSSLADPATLLAEFDLRTAGSEEIGGVTHCVIDGARRPGAKSGVQSGRVWIDPASWLIGRIRARYWWGDLHVELDYGRVQGRTVLTRQHARMASMGIDLAIEYADYRFGSEASDP